MSDSKIPLVGPVYGFRVWDLDVERSEWIDDQPVLTSRATEWHKPDQWAKCTTSAFDRAYNQIATQIMWTVGPAPEPKPDPEEDHAPASDPNCWCGLYAHTTLARCLDVNAAELRGQMRDDNRRTVLGLVSASGSMFAAERGFRAQRMTVDTLVCLHHPNWRDKPLYMLFRPGHQPHVRQVAADLDVDVVCAELSKPSLSQAFADREGVYLWRKDAPWTSDATSTSTKFSTGSRKTYTAPKTVSLPAKSARGASASMWVSGESWSKSADWPDDLVL